MCLSGTAGAAFIDYNSDTGEVTLHLSEPTVTSPTYGQILDYSLSSDANLFVPQNLLPAFPEGSGTTARVDFIEERATGGVYLGSECELGCNLGPILPTQLSVGEFRTVEARSRTRYIILLGNHEFPFEINNRIRHLYNGNAVPEPSAFFMSAFALACFAAVVRRFWRRKSKKKSESVVPDDD